MMFTQQQRRMVFSVMSVAFVALAGAEYVYEIPTKAPLHLLPGASTLNPITLVNKIAITQAPVKWQLTNKAGNIVTFTAPGYVSDSTGQPLMFGPTLRVRRGDKYSIRLSNALVQSEPVTPGYGYADEHLPGHHWYHPHKHGSTTLQTSTSHGHIIVEDDPFWLPYNKGLCGPLQAILATAPSVVLDFTLLFFNTTIAAGNSMFENPPYQVVSNYSRPQNPLCCDGKNGYEFSGSATKGIGQDLILLNGGYQPQIYMVGSVWYRWRMLYAGAKGWFTLNVLTADGKQTPDCEIQLIAKDGVYMMRVPRKVSAVLLAAGNRVEALVRCKPSTSAKTEYILSAGTTEDAFNPGQNGSFVTDLNRIAQGEVARLVVQGTDGKHQLKAANYAQKLAAASQDTSSSQASLQHCTTAQAAATPEKYCRPPPFKPIHYHNLVEESCIPLRPSYATDLSNTSLAAANYPLSDIYYDVVNFSGNDSMGMKCAVNNELFTFPDPNPLVMPLGRIVEWSFNKPKFHPMHVHVNPFQIVAMRLDELLQGTTLGNFWKVGDYADNLFMPQLGFVSGALQPNGTTTLRFQPGGYSGYAVMHCHFLDHEDLGCMKVVQWKCPGYDKIQPMDGGCPNFKYPVPGVLPPRPKHWSKARP